MMLYCSRQFKNKLSFRSFALPLYKIGCTREFESKLSFRSFALPLYKIGFGSAISSLVKLCFPALMLHSPCTIFV